MSAELPWGRPVLKAPPPDPAEYKPLPHGARPMWVSLEEYIRLYVAECRRRRRPADDATVSQWIEMWYSDASRVLVDCGPKGVIPYCLISVYPEDEPLVEKWRKRK